MPDRAFTTDGCSGGMSWVWRTLTGSPPPWEGACVQHDLAYWRGGTAAERRRADNNLWAAVANGGHPAIALAMYLAVRIGGHWLLPTPWRWGYGWRWDRFRGYAPATDDLPWR
jgi:hypothetical protein